MATTSEAADAAGIRYETLRNWLKKGLFSEQREPGGKWRHYSNFEIARIQLCKDGVNAGIALDVMIDVCNDLELIAFIEQVMPSSSALRIADSPYVLIWPTMPETQYMFARKAALVQELSRNSAPVTILDIAHACLPHAK